MKISTSRLQKGLETQCVAENAPVGMLRDVWLFQHQGHTTRMSWLLARLPCMQKEKTRLAMLHVRGAAVRFVHVPGRLDPNSAIVAHRRRVAEAAKAARRQHDAGQPPYQHDEREHDAFEDSNL